MIERRREIAEHTGARTWNHEHGVGDLVLGAKWLAVESCPFGARHALAPSVKFPTASDRNEMGSGKTDADLLWIASRDIGARAGLHLNLGYSWIGGEDEDVAHGGVAVDVALTDTVQWVGEVFAEREVTGGGYEEVQWTSGFRWAATDALTLDLAGGTKIGREGPDWTATAGLTWLFSPLAP